MIAVLDYGIGNLASAHKALLAVGADARLITDPGDANGASAVVLPGVGSFGACMKALRESRLDKVVLDAVVDQVPVLGICVGLQMLFDGSEESPEASGLGVISGKVARISNPHVKLPQMQWNRLDFASGDDALFNGLPDKPWVYFVHSYAAQDTDATIARCDYGGPVVAAVRQRQVWATQFHPEKSGEIGLQILRNFVAIADSEANR